MYDEQLKMVYQSKPGAAELFAALAVAPPAEGRTTVEDAMTMAGISRPHAIQLLKALADGGGGEFKVGRKGHPSRLQWGLDVVELAAWLIGGSKPEPRGHDERDETTSEGAKVEDEDGPSSSAKHGAGRPAQASFALQSPPTRPAPMRAASLVEHTYVLRPQLRLRVALPEDLSPAEAAVLADWIRNLSFER